MKPKFSTIAMIIITAIVISTLATISTNARASFHDRTPVATSHTEAGTADVEALPRALTPDPSKFRAKHLLTASTPNFGRPIRRAPIRRKGRIQH